MLSKPQNSGPATSLCQDLLPPPQTEQPLVWLWSTSWSHAEFWPGCVVHQSYKGVCYQARRSCYCDVDQPSGSCLVSLAVYQVSPQAWLMPYFVHCLAFKVMWLPIIGCGLAPRKKNGWLSVINLGIVQICGQHLVMIVIIRIDLWLLVTLMWLFDSAHSDYINKRSKRVWLEDGRKDPLISYGSQSLLFLLPLPEVSVQFVNDFKDSFFSANHMFVFSILGIPTSLLSSAVCAFITANVKAWSCESFGNMDLFMSPCGFYFSSISFSKLTIFKSCVYRCALIREGTIDRALPPDGDMHKCNVLIMLIR